MHLDRKIQCPFTDQIRYVSPYLTWWDLEVFSHGLWFWKAEGEYGICTYTTHRGFCSATYPCAMRLRLCLSGKRLYLGYICMKRNDTFVCRTDIPRINLRSDLKVNWKSQMSVFRCITDAVQNSCNTCFKSSLLIFLTLSDLCWFQTAYC